MHTMRDETYRAFLMTDLVGSTSLTQQFPHEYRAALADHNRLAEEIFELHKGRVIKTRGQGDGLLGAFAAPTDAVRAAIAFREKIRPDTCVGGNPLSCRLAVNYGPCYGMDHDFFGHTLNLCGRLRDIGHGGQILSTGIVAELIAEVQSEGIKIRDLGWHRLKDVAGAVKIVQISNEAEDFPALKTTSRFRMPSFATALVGRTAEIAKIGQLLASSRVVLLVGPGGIGKTRLAAAAAEQFAEKQGVPCAFISMIEAVDQTSVEQVIADSLGGATFSALSHVLDGDLVLVLDNCEHVAEEARRVVNTLIEGFPRIKVIATSRTRVAFNQGLALPLEGLKFGAGEDAESLFVQLARSSDATFDVDEAERTALDDLCRAAQGIPLVIELAAAHISTLSLGEISQRVLELSRQRTSDHLGRHRSIDATLKSSIEVLDHHVQGAAGVLSWFAGGFTLETARLVAGTEAELAVGELVRHSLLRFDRHSAAGPRYNFLEVVRTFVRDELGGKSPSQAHLEWILKLAERLSNRPNDEAVLLEAGIEMPNVRVALQRLESEGDPQRLGLRIATNLARIWLISSVPEGKFWLESMLAHHPHPDDDHASLMLYANANNRLGALAYKLQEWTVASIHYAQALKFAEAAGNLALAMSIRLNEGLVLGEQGLLEEARPLLVEAEDYFRMEGLTPHRLLSILNLGRVELRRGDYKSAELLLVEASRQSEALGDMQAFGVAQLNLAEAALLQNRSDADEHLQKVTPIEHTLDAPHRALLYMLVGICRGISGDRKSGVEALEFSEAILQEAGSTLNEFDLGLRTLMPC